jgi:hypothetical protein
MEKLEFYMNKKASIQYLVLAVAWLAGGIALIMYGYRTYHTVLGILSIIVPLYLAFITIYRLVNYKNTAVVSMDAAGIFNKRWKLGPIPWAAVNAVWIGKFQKQTFLCFDIDKSVLSGGVPAKNKNPLSPFPAFTLWLDDLKPGIDAAWQYLEAQIPERVREPTIY